MISAVINTYNEEKNIKKCLSSLLWADEIIVVDMGSTDKTREIAEEFGAKVYEHNYVGFVEPARNFGIEKAHGEWVFILDADERVSQILSKLLLEKSRQKDINYFRVARKNIIFDKWIKHAGWWPDYQIRFFRKGSVSWVEKIHGIPFTVGNGFDMEASEDLSIIHNNYQSITQYLTRMDRYTSIMAKELSDSGYYFSVSDVFGKPVSEFLNRFFAQEGYKDGLHGLSLSLLQAFSELIVYLKVWESIGFKPHTFSIDDLGRKGRSIAESMNYWLINEQLKKDPSYPRKFIIKLKNKLRI
ncbi:hypothetical protein A3D77_07145 [Candidatus Gottesmanbacteria bacterium RIFCSPHIGHO2_02_FULL_39_11]|uniref:Glycosyltransferase 2-like domain-containing protein n=1 Tax=Candidatus Gottesmanbacteria bacterium RIFCSPHIGHO2_02_FULL_39_11 TaxID=1798382 RepID=A0A1F5ZKF5_9BACT|nr:MAG: hypothetical protein A3D77_07145 [Candidatus Gottesmanbacteria bacterium RIFCSPHIGHO2_02_FULL_39_11]